MQVYRRFLFVSLILIRSDAFWICSPEQRRKAGGSLRRMADTPNEASPPTIAADKFSSAMYLDQLPIAPRNTQPSSSSNPYLSWLEATDVSNVAPWGATTYWSPPGVTEEKPQQPTNDASMFTEPSPSIEQVSPSLQTKVDGFAPPLTVGVEVPSMEVPGTQRVVVWKERKDTARFGMYNRFDARDVVARNKVPPAPIDPNNPEGSFVTETFYLSDEARNAEAGNATVADPMNRTSDSSEEIPTSPTSISSVNPPFNVATDKSPASFYAPFTATAASDEVPLVGTPFRVAETSPAAFYAPRTATALPEAGTPSTFFLDDAMPYESENATALPDLSNEDATANEPRNSPMPSAESPISSTDNPAATDGKWNLWNEYRISNRYEGREPRTRPEPLDPNDVSGKSSVTQAFFLGDDMDAAFEPDVPLTEAAPVEPDVPEEVSVTSDINQVRKPELKQQTTNFLVLQDQKFMRLAIALASTESARSSYPCASVGAVLTRADGTILGKGFSNFKRDALRSVLENAGLVISLSNTGWNITWPEDEGIRKDMARSTLYVTLEPSADASGITSPPITQLIEQAGIPRVVIGTSDPIPEIRGRGIQALSAVGIEVIADTVLSEECIAVNQDYIRRANSKLQCLAREHFKKFGRPLAFTCDADTTESKNAESSFRMDEYIWADESVYTSIESDSLSEISSSWYAHADAFVVTIPSAENDEISTGHKSNRFSDLEWLATSGVSLPAGMERIVVADAVDLKNIPTQNGDPQISPRVDIEAFWIGRNRRPTRIILKSSGNMRSQADAQAAMAAAQEAVVFATQMASAMESRNSMGGADAVEAAIQQYRVAQSHAERVFAEFRETIELRRKLELKGVVIDFMEGGLPIDIMNVLATTTAHRSVIWKGSRHIS